MALPEYNGDWVPDWSDNYNKFIILRYEDDIMKYIGVNYYNKITFKSEEIRDKFLENNLDLLKEYFELD